MKYVLGLLLLLSIYSCRTKNILYTDYVLIEKVDGTKDTLIHKYWNKFTWDEYKMEWFIKSYNLDVEDISNIKVLYVTKQKFSNKELGK